MRLGFGLVGLLVTMAVIVIIMRMTDMNSAVLSANHSARNEASQISGHDANGDDSRKSATLADTMKNNKLVSYQVTARHRRRIRQLLRLAGE